MATRLHDIKTDISTKIVSLTTNISNGASNVSNTIKSGVKGILNSVSNAKNYVVSSFTISNENKEKIKALPIKIMEFIKENKSLIFFGLTVLFSYYMVSAKAFEFIADTGFSFTNSLISGMTLGTGLLALKNILFSYPIRNAQKNTCKINQDDKINYLLGITNLFLVYINPVQSLRTIIGLAGFMVVKTAYKIFLPADEIQKDPEITFLLPKELAEETNQFIDTQTQAD